jgi:hypothetical protein
MVTSDGACVSQCAASDDDVNSRVEGRGLRLQRVARSRLCTLLVALPWALLDIGGRGLSWGSSTPTFNRDTPAEGGRAVQEAGGGSLWNELGVQLSRAGAIRTAVHAFRVAVELLEGVVGASR